MNGIQAYLYTSGLAFVSMTIVKVKWIGWTLMCTRYTLVFSARLQHQRIESLSKSAGELMFDQVFSKSHLVSTPLLLLLLLPLQCTLQLILSRSHHRILYAHFSSCQRFVMRIKICSRTCIYSLHNTSHIKTSL